MNRTSTVSFLRGISLVGVYGGLLMPLVFIPIVIFPFVFSKLIVFQVLIGLTFPAYVFLAWMEPIYRPKYHLLYTALIAYFAALLLSVFFAADPFRAWWGNQERMNGLFTLLHFFLWLTMAVGLVKDWSGWRRLLNYEIVLSAIMAIVALLQIPFPRLLLFPATIRVGGLLDNPIYMGAYQIFNLAFLTLLFLKTPSRKVRIFYAVIALIDIAAFFAAQSRGALVGLAAGIFVLGVFYAFFTKRKAARYGILGAVFCFFLAYGVLFALRDTSFVQRSGFARLTDFSAATAVETRFIAWRIAWQGFLERPLTGWGLDSFHLLFNSHYNPLSLRHGSYETWFDRSHNTILDVLSMTGLFGFLTFAFVFSSLWWSVWRAFRLRRIDLPTTAILIALPIAYFVQNLFVFDHPAAFSMSFLLFALVIAATRGNFFQLDEKPSVIKASPRSLSWTGFVVVEFVMAFVVWRTSVLPFYVSSLSISANQAFASPQALVWMKKAANIWTPYLDEQTFLLSRNLITYAAQGVLQKLPDWKDRYALAKQLTEEEVRRHPLNTHPHFIYAELAMSVANILPEEAAVAEREYRKAIETSPKRQQVWYGLANLYLRTNRLDQALDIYKKVRDFDPELGDGRWMYGLTLVYNKRDYINGAQELIKSQTVSYPHEINDARELVPLADASVILRDQIMLRRLADLVPTLPVSSVTYYAQIAYRLGQMQMLEEENRVLAFAEKNGLDVKSALEAIVKPSSAQTLTAP